MDCLQASMQLSLAQLAFLANRSIDIYELLRDLGSLCNNLMKPLTQVGIIIATV